MRAAGSEAPLRVRRVGPDGWLGRIGRVHMSDEDGEVSRAQAVMDEAARQALPTLRDKAAA